MAEQTLPLPSLVKACLTRFHLPASLTLGLDRYYILYWESSYLKEITLPPGKIIREGIDYLLIYTDDLLPSTLPEHIRISFRKIPSFTYGYAMVGKIPDRRSVLEIPS